MKSGARLALDVKPDVGVPLFEEVRDGRTQAVHAGHAVVLDADGHVERRWGDPATGAYWRSCLKPVQAVPFVESGAADACGAELLALACASHNGEPVHVDGARRILASVGLGPEALKCGAHDPIGGALGGPMPPGGWTALHNNCSGKHAGMLAACVRRGWPTADYLDPEHPLQLRVRALVGELTGEPVAWGMDGCSAPNFWSTLAGMARATQRLARMDVGRRILDAMASHPYMVGGGERFCTALMAGSKGAVVGKVGAAGLYVALHRASGRAFALKISSGGRDLGEQAAAHMAHHLGWLDDKATEAVKDYLRQRIVTWNGVQVGTTRSLL